ncbi:Mitochondrial glutamate carrier 2 [Trichoplax sp. H2]|nr:Mitochondrial glutamate carrier 2 [Trichoplax sp. H2]|eukprot:RDD45795.1 Mitochondrial glutamate carrier 2 [Trichoplax sp. H2]
MFFLSSFTPRFLNGAIAGTVAVTCTYPLDLVKTRMQEQRSHSQRMYRNMLDCFIKVGRSEGFRGLYKGYAVNIVLINPEKAVKLAVNDELRHVFKGNRKTIPIAAEMAAGAGAGFCQVIITCPMEFLKIHMQMAGKAVAQPGGVEGKTAAAFADSKRPSALKFAIGELRNKGISGIYRGLGATWMRDIPFSLIYFPAFAHFNKMGTRENGKVPWQHSILAGCLAGSIATVSVNPCDVIKTRLQALDKDTGKARYSGIVDCVRTTFKQEGITAFFKGCTPRIIVISPLFGIANTVYLLGVAERLLGRDYVPPV